MFEAVEIKRDKMGYWMHPVFDNEDYDEMPVSDIPECRDMKFSYCPYPDEEKWEAAENQLDVSD